MRLVTLNTWGGSSMRPLAGFFRKYGPETDVFCLQEVFDGNQEVLDAKYPGQYLRADLFRRIAQELPDFAGHFARFEGNPNAMSQALFVRRSLPVREVAAHVVHVPEKPFDDGRKVIAPRQLQTVKIGREDGTDLLLANVHGLWVDGPKTDIPERLAQSREIAAILNAHDGPKVALGDFNLLPDTESLRLLAESAGLRNLVVEHGVAGTRTPLYRHYHNAHEPNYADYVLPSRDLPVERFEVLPDIVSDHCALRVELR